MMAGQIQQPNTTQSTIAPKSTIAPNQEEEKENEGTQISTTRALDLLANIFLGAGKNIKGGNIITALKRVIPRIQRKQNNENKMNYDKLKQKLFEAVSKEDMPCNKPRASTRPGKKKMVKACEGGKEKIVHFGAKGYGHNYSPKARKSFKARHKCGEKKSKLSAQYWACKNLWAGPKGSKASCPAGRKCKY